MMNPDTKFLIKRMDMLEHKLLIEMRILQQESKRLSEWKSKTLGMGVGAMSVISFLVHFLMKKLGG